MAHYYSNTTLLPLSDQRPPYDPEHTNRYEIHTNGFGVYLTLISTDHHGKEVRVLLFPEQVAEMVRTLPGEVITAMRRGEDARAQYIKDHPELYK